MVGCLLWWFLIFKTLYKNVKNYPRIFNKTISENIHETTLQTCQSSWLKEFILAMVFYPSFFCTIPVSKFDRYLQKSICGLISNMSKIRQGKTEKKEEKNIFIEEKLNFCTYKFSSFAKIKFRGKKTSHNHRKTPGFVVMFITSRPVVTLCCWSVYYLQLLSDVSRSLLMFYKKKLIWNLKLF